MKYLTSDAKGRNHKLMLKKCMKLIKERMKNKERLLKKTSTRGQSLFFIHIHHF